MRSFSGVVHLIRHPRSSSEGIRDYPTYSILDAALILAMPRRTLQSWVNDKPIFSVAGSREEAQTLLSFKDLAQLYFLKFVRRHAGLSDAQARMLLEYAKKVTRSEYPLLHENIKVFRRHVQWEYDKSGEKKVLELLKPQGQYILTQEVNMFSSRVDRDGRGATVRLYPWRLWRTGDERRPVSIDPTIMSGKLVLTGTRIPVLAVAARKKSGELVADIARDYGISQLLVTESLRHLNLALRKAA